MQNTSINKKVLNLSQKSPKEISEVLQAILSLRYQFMKQGMNLEIKIKNNKKKIR